MPYWLCITNSENWEVIKKENLWGVSDAHRNQISGVKLGDKLLIYGILEKINKEILESRIYGIYEAKSKVFKNNMNIFRYKPKGELFPNRVKLKPLVVPNEPLKFKPLIEKLSFIKNKRKWNTHLFGRAMRSIPEEDYKTIEQFLTRL